MKLSIIIPVFNEKSTIATILQRVNKVKLPKGADKEIIIVDDGSSDGTADVIANFKKNKRWKILSHFNNLGKGAAVKTGIKSSSGGIIIIQDGDLEYDPSYYSRLIEPVYRKKELVVYGSRLVNYPLNLLGEHKTVLPTHLIANKFLTFLTNILYGSCLTDMETGYKVFNINALKNIDIKSKRFDFEAEITAKILKKGIKIVEVPILTTPRTYKEGKKIGWKDGVVAIWTLFKYKFID